MSAALPALPATVRRVFISYLDTHLGTHLAAKLAARDDYEVSGVVRDPNNAATFSARTKRVFKRSEVDGIRRALLESDYIVYHTPGSAEDSVNAIRVLTSNHYETEKRFILASSVMSWFQTPALQDAAPPEGDEPPELEALTEDQFNRRVPHVKYLAWRDVEKLCASSQSDRLKTFVVFTGLLYGLGEDVLEPFFKQAWTLCPEGLPIYGSGQQIVPMVHTSDACTFLSKLMTVEEVPDIRYLFAVDEGSCSWKGLVGAINATLGNNKTFRVPHAEFGLHDNIEQFIVNLKIEPGYIRTIMAEDSDWVAKGGFVECIEAVYQEFRTARSITPLRVLILGPPSAGKSFAARELAAHYKLPHYTIADIIAEYKFQEVELQEEILRIKNGKAAARRQERVDEKRAAILAERRSAREAELAAAADAADSASSGLAAMPEEDVDDQEDEDDIEVTFTAEEEKELADAGADDDSDEAVALLQEKLGEIKRVLAMKLKPVGVETTEAPNPKDKKAKPAPKPAKGGKAEPVEPRPDEGARDANRLSDRALAFMIKWKLTRMESRNMGYVLDGYPKTIRQARLVFEDVPIEVPEDPDEPDLPLDKEEKPCAEALFPDVLIHCRANDTFLLERLQKTQHEHPHNTPEDFQRRLELYKQHFEVPLGVIQYFESAKSTTGRMLTAKPVDLDSAPLVPPPPPKSQYAAKVVDPIIAKLIDFIGKPHNFGPTPEDTLLEAERARMLAAEAKAEQAANAKLRADREQADIAQAEASKMEQTMRVTQMKDVERQMLEQRKGPLKAYLMANVIPILTKGLIEVCNRRPEDPVDFLAEWLFKHNPEDHPEMYS